MTKEEKAIKVTEAAKAVQAQLGHREKKVFLVIQDHQDVKVFLVLQDLMVTRVIVVQMDWMVSQD